MVAATGTNTLGFFVWTLALTVMSWLATVGDGYLKNHRQRLPNPLFGALRDSWFSGTLLLAGVVLLVMIAWAVSTVVVIYRDHTGLVAENAQLRESLASRGTRGLSLKISGIVMSEVNGDSTRLQLTIVAANDGEPTVARGWKMTLHTSHGDLSSFHAFGDTIAKGSLDLPRLDARLQQPIDGGVEVPGLVSFVIKHVSKSLVEKLKDDPSATVMVSVLDRNDKEIRTERNIAEMAAERFVHMPSK
jgi:hypothetical protein